jgi:hypothetical protein
MSVNFDADAFALRKLTLNGAEYHFRPATIKDEFEYLTPVIRPAILEALQAKDNEKYTALMVEVIKKKIESIPEDDLYDIPISLLSAIFYYVLNGVYPEDEKN